MTNPKCGQNICSVNMGNLTAGIKSHSPDAKTRWRFKVLLFKLAVLAGKKKQTLSALQFFLFVCFFCSSSAVCCSCPSYYVRHQNQFNLLFSLLVYFACVNILVSWASCKSGRIPALEQRGK